MANTYSLNDIQSIYNKYDPKKPRDAARVTSNLGPGPWSYEQLTGANRSGLSSRSNDLLDQVLNTIKGLGVGTPTTPVTDPATNTMTPPTTPYGATNNTASDVGLGPFTTPKGPVEQGLFNLISTRGSAATTPPAGPVESMLGNMLGQGYGQFVTPQSKGESSLEGLLGSPFIQSLLGGKIPQGALSQYRDETNRQNAQIIESMGTMGQRFGTGIIDRLARADQEGLNRLLATSEGNALGALSGLGNVAGAAGSLSNARYNQAVQAYTQLVGQGVNAETAREISGLNAFTNIAGQLYGGELERGNQAMKMAWQTYMQQQGIPMSIIQQIIGMIPNEGTQGMGTGQTTTTTAGNPTAEIGKMVMSALLMAAMMP